MQRKLSTALAILACASATFYLGRMSAGPGGSGNRPDSSGPLSPARQTSGLSEDGAGGKAPSSVSKRAKAVSRGDSRDRSSELAAILRRSNPIERNRALLEWMDQLGPAELKSAVEKFRALGLTGQRQAEYATLLSYWAQKEPAAALEDAAAQGNNDNAVRTILATWALNDPDAALAWAEAAHPTDSNNPYLAAILGNLAVTDPARATDLLSKMPAGREQDRAISEILRNTLVQGPDIARNWIASIGNADLRANAIVQVGGDMARIDPEGTAAWLAGQNGPGADQGVFHMMSAWNDKDSAAAASYYQSLPSGPLRSNALGGLIASTAQNNPGAAAALMDRYPADVSNDVVNQFVRSSAKSDPALAAGYIGRITDPQQQTDAFDRVLSRWIRKDQAAATAWIQANPVPAEVRKSLGLIR